MPRKESKHIFWFHDLNRYTKRGYRKFPEFEIRKIIRAWFVENGFTENDYKFAGDGMNIPNTSIAVLFKMTWNNFLGEKRECRWGHHI